MQITGTFNDINDTKSYTVTITIPRVNRPDITVKDVTDADFNETTDTILFPLDPIDISVDYSDTFSHVIVKSATVRLVSNFNLKDLVLSNNNRDIKMQISVTENNTTKTIFSGYVEPLAFNEPYAHVWETIEITATDDLATAQYIKYPTLRSVAPVLNQMSTFDTIINNVADALGLDVEYDGLDREIEIDQSVQDFLSGTKISNSIWAGESPDDFMSCYDVLEQVGKYWGIWFIEYEGKLRCFNWHNETRTNVTLTKNDFTDTSTNLSNADAYTQIKLTCNVDDADTIIEFGEDITSPYPHYVKYLEELVAEGDGSRALKLFTNLVKNDETADETDKKHPSESYIYKNFCWVKQSNLWDFGSNSYTDLIGETNPITHEEYTQQEILQWLRANPGKGAFVSFGRTDKMTLKDKSPINSLDLRDYLIISVMGQDVKSYDSTMKGILESAAPICSFKGSAKAFTPPDSDTTNYLIISGNILLNKLYAQTGKVMHRKNKDKKTFGEEYDGINGSLYLDSLNTFADVDRDFDDNKLIKGVNPDYMNQSVPKIGENDWGCYYIHRFYDGEAGSEYAYTGSGNNKTYVPVGLYGDLKQSKYNQTWKYEWSFINGQGKKVDNTSKVPILICQMKIGDGENAKYCVERIDLGTDGWGKFQWLTDAQIKGREPWVNPITGITQTQEIKIENNYWYNFTIGIDPKIDDYIIGTEYDIQNTIWYYDDVDGKGTAIPIKYNDNLAGEVEFKIIKPILAYWGYSGNEYRLWVELFWDLDNGDSFKWPILEKLSSIMLSDFKIELTSNKGHILNNTANNDLVYPSVENNTYIEPHEDDVDIATMITSEEAARWGTEMVQSDSHVLISSNDQTKDNMPFLGFEYDTGEVDEEQHPIMAYVKPEQLYVNDFYHEYSTPRTVVNTQIKLNTNYLANPDKYSFTYPTAFNLTKEVHVPIGYEADLKYDTISLTTKNMQINDNGDESN